MILRLNQLTLFNTNITTKSLISFWQKLRTYCFTYFYKIIMLTWYESLIKKTSLNDLEILTIIKLLSLIANQKIVQLKKWTRLLKSFFTK